MHESKAGAHPSYVLSFEQTEAEFEAELTATFFKAPVDKKTRHLGFNGVKSLLKELKKNPNVATVHAFSDFPYTANNSLPIPLMYVLSAPSQAERFGMPAAAGLY